MSPPYDGLPNKHQFVQLLTKSEKTPITKTRLPKAAGFIGGCIGCPVPCCDSYCTVLRSRGNSVRGFRTSARRVFLAS